MDNHFHLILFGTEEDCVRYVECYKRITALWTSKHRGQPLKEPMSLGHWPVSQDKLAEKTAYVFRNPLAAGIKCLPTGYLWSSAATVFHDSSRVLAASSAASSFSGRAKCRMFYTREVIPDDWRILPSGILWPGDYTVPGAVEKIFGSPGQFMFMLNNKGIDHAAEEEMIAGTISLPDGDVRLRAVEIAAELFGKDRLSGCSAEQRFTIARVLRKELDCNRKQLARITGLRMSELSLLT